MKLKILGTQSPYNTPGHNCPGFLITDAETDPGTTFRSLKWKGKGDTILHLSK